MDEEIEEPNLSHIIRPVNDLDFIDRPGKTPAHLLKSKAYSAKIIYFPKGHEIAMHSHGSGPLYKFVIVGAIEYDDNDQVLLPGDMGMVEEDVKYKGKALRDTYMLLLTPNTPG